MSSLSVVKNDDTIESILANNTRYQARYPECMLGVTVTPEVAALVLRNYNTRNRMLSDRSVERLADTIRSGEYVLNGESIIFARNGVLLDGQHRLAACVRSGLPIQTDIRFDIDPNVFDRIDIGRKRTVGDNLKINGDHENANVLAAALRLLSCWDDNNFTFKGGITPHAAFDLLAANPGMHESVILGKRYRTGFGGIPASLWAFVHYICAKVNRTEADTFFENISHRIGMTKTDSCFAFSRYCQNQRPRDQQELIYLLIDAFNKRHDPSVKVLRFDISTRNAFPRPE